MSSISTLPFESARKAAEALTDLRVQSLLLSELAQRQLATGQFDAALKTFAAISAPQERRIALLVANFQAFPMEKIEPLVQLLTLDPHTKTLAGRLALSMLDAKNTDPAWKLIETAPEPFESEQQRYDFLAKALPLIQESGWDRAQRLYRTFAKGMYQDWASLAIIKYLAGQQRYSDMEEYIGLLSSPLRRSWAYGEVCRLSPPEQSGLKQSKLEQSSKFFDKAVEIIESIEITSDEDEEMEKLAIQLRIFGRAAFQKGKKEQGERLLERSEAAAASLTLLMQRYRQQCFLGKVLRELRLIDSIRDYAAIETMLPSLRTGLDRSRMLVWLAEAGWNEGWTQAIEAVSVPERGITEAERGEQIAHVLKRFVAHHQGYKATGDPSEDATGLSGEDFETLYRQGQHCCCRFAPFQEPLALFLPVFLKGGATENAKLNSKFFHFFIIYKSGFFVYSIRNYVKPFS
jgi:hypothetical protein